MADPRLFELYHTYQDLKVFKATVTIDFGPEPDLQNRLLSALKLPQDSTPALASLAPSSEKRVNFKAVCPQASAKQRADYIDREFIHLGESESECRSYDVKIVTEILPLRIGDRTPPKLLAFLTFRWFEEHDRSVTKRHSLVTFGHEPETSLEWRSPTLIYELDQEAFLYTTPTFNARIPNRPFVFPITFHTQHWTQSRYPVSTLPNEIVQTISSFLPLPSVQSLAQAVPAFRGVLSTEPTRRMTELLSPYFQDNIKGFVDIILSTGSLIAASNVLYAFQGKMESWTPNDLDLVVPAESVSTVYLYLMDRGWKPDPTSPGAKATAYDVGSYGETGWKVHTVVKGTRKIDIVSPTNVVHPIDFPSHSTAPMAFLTGTLLGHLFPDLTLAHQSLRSTFGRAQGPSDGHAARAKYTARGYKLLGGLAVPEYADSDNVLSSVKSRIWKTAVDFK